MVVQTVSPTLAGSALPARSGAEVLEEAELEEEGVEEAEVALDEIIRRQFAPTPSEPDFGEAEVEAEPEEIEAPAWLFPNDTPLPVQPDEFVCRRCFLIRRRVLLGDSAGLLCRDCATA